MVSQKGEGLDLGAKPPCNLFTNRDSVTSNSPRDTESKVAIPQLQGGVQCCGIASKSSCGRQTLCTVLKRLTLANFYPIDSESFVQLQRHGSHGKQAYTVYTLFYLFSFITFAVADTGEGHGGPPLFLDQNGGLKGRKIFLETGTPPPPPLSEGLDAPLHLYIKYQVATLSYSIIYI